MKADLHLHTTASDGNLSPQELVRLAVDLDMDVIAITDHDCVDGIAPALDEAQRFPKLRVIPGVEVSTDVPHGEIHVLGYFITHLDSDLAATLERFRNSRQLRAQKMVEKLARLGVEVDWRRVKEVAGSGSIGRPHIAQVMLEQGYVSSSKDAFAKYIGRDVSKVISDLFSFGFVKFSDNIYKIMVIGIKFFTQMVNDTLFE